MAQIAAENLSDLENLAYKVRLVLQQYASDKKNVMFEAFDLHEMHNALVLFKAIDSLDDKKTLSHILRSPIHVDGIQGAITKSLQKLGITGVTADFYTVLEDFHQAFLATEELRPDLLPNGFVIVKIDDEKGLSSLERDEFRKAEQKKRELEKGKDRKNSNTMQI